MPSALVPYRSSSSTSLTTATNAVVSSISNSLSPSRVLTVQTGHALATELLYRLLFDILNRLLTSLHRFAAHQFDTFTSYLERTYNERQEARREALEAVKAARSKVPGEEGGLGIADEVGRKARESGFLGGAGRGDGLACPLKGGKQVEKEWKPRGWVADVLDGISEGRMVEKDFWVHPFQN